MNILEDYFATTYPINMRRADLAKLRKSSWMTNSEFADLYIQKCNEAQVTCGKLKFAMGSGSIAPPAPSSKQTSGKSGTGSKKFKGRGKANMIAGAEEEESSEEEDNGVIHHVSRAKHAPQTLM